MPRRKPASGNRFGRRAPHRGVREVPRDPASIAAISNHTCAHNRMLDQKIRPRAGIRAIDAAVCTDHSEARPKAGNGSDRLRERFSGGHGLLRTVRGADYRVLDNSVNKCTFVNVSWAAFLIWRRRSRGWAPAGVRVHRILSPLVADHSFPSTKSTTQQPRTCSPGCRQWVSTSSLSQPASWRASARIGIRSKARSL